MKSSIGIGCPMRQTAWVNFLLKFSLLLLITILFPPKIYAQCGGDFHGIDAYAVSSRCERGDFGQNVAFIDLQVSGTQNASQFRLALEFLEALPKIDSIQLEWMYPDVLPMSQLNWAQGNGNRELNVDLILDGCKPVTGSVYRFRLKAFGIAIPADQWSISKLHGGIVQVDVIQAKTSLMETQRIYRIDGTLMREMVQPLGARPVTQGLETGLYLIQRIVDGQVTRREKLLVL